MPWHKRPLVFLENILERCDRPRWKAIRIEDLHILKALSATIAAFCASGRNPLGAIAHDLEILFERLFKRSPELERAFYDFWNAAEIISVDYMDAKRFATERELAHANTLLRNLEKVVEGEIKMLER